jgi:hypothetical protein
MRGSSWNEIIQLYIIGIHSSIDGLELQVKDSRFE